MQNMTIITMILAEANYDYQNIISDENTLYLYCKPCPAVSPLLPKFHVLTFDNLFISLQVPKDSI